LREQFLGEGGGPADTNLSRIYKITKSELIQMFQARFGGGAEGGDANGMLSAHGGPDGITKKLATDANSGIIGDERDLERRAKMFGKNTMPTAPYGNWLDSFQDIVKERMWWFAAGTALLASIGGWI